MKRFFLAVVAIVSSVSAMNAQDYLLDYGPGSVPWCAQMTQQINAISQQNAMMQAQILNYYQQQAWIANQHMMNTPFVPMQGVMTYDGVYLTPETHNDYHKEDVRCEHCDGGYNYRTTYMGGGQVREVKSRCSFCHGKGFVTRTVKND